MKLPKNLSEVRVARLLQLIAHPTYIGLGTLFYYGFQRPFYYYPLLMIVAYSFFLIFMSIANVIFKKKESLWTFTPIIIAGTLMLNLEAYNFKTYAIAGLLAVLSRCFIKTDFGHIFNPGYLGVFILAMLLPKSGYPSLGLWRSDPEFLVSIFFLGSFVVYKAKRLWLIGGYIFGFVSIAVATSIVLKILNFKYNGLTEVPVLFWPAALSTTTSLIFIFHVISDPKTSPSPLRQQIVFGVLIGLVDYFLRISLILPAEAIAYLLIQSFYSIYKVYESKNMKCVKMTDCVTRFF